MSDEPWTFLMAIEKPALIPVVDDALRAAGIPCRTGLQIEPTPMVVFTVPTSRVEAARPVVDAALRRHRARRPAPGDVVGTEDPGEEDEPDADATASPEPFEVSDTEEERREREAPPWGALQAAIALVLVHFVVLFVVVGRNPTTSHLVDVGALARAGITSEPWRLLTSLFLHADVEHVAWNALSMIAFAVPLIVALGYGRTIAIYAVSGIAGGLAALAATPAAVTVGSSGAVAGLFGAWLARTLRRARRKPPTTKALLRTVGVGLLVLPSLLSPTTADGKSVSIAAHLGGLAAGLALGASLPEAARRDDLPLS
jgi:membrane associated rhomboid family serine protease